MAVIRRRKSPWVGRQNDGVSESNASAAREKSFDDLTQDQRGWVAQALAGLALLAGSSPVELAVPAIRSLLGQRGIQTGAALGSLLSFLAGRADTGSALRQLLAEGSSGVETEHGSW